MQSVVGAGDVLCQFVIENATLDTFDWARCGRLVLVNCVLVGPTLTVWYGALGRWTSAWGEGLAPTLKRMLIDQLAFAPAFIAVFFLTAATIEGKPEDGVRRIQVGWKDAVLTNYSIWPAAQLVNFGLVPPHLRVLFANMVGVVWNSYLSFATARVRKVEPAEPESPSD
jgi:protein Mpv17